MKYAVFMTLVFTALFVESKVYGQSAVFSQYYASALYLNPALAGLEKDTYLGMNYRWQWNNLSLPFTTFQFSFIQPITQPGAHKKHIGGIGLSFLNDVAGANKEFVTQGISVAGAYNYHLNRHGNNIIATAFQLGASQQRINYDGLRWSSQYSSFSGFDKALPGEASLTNNQVFQPILNAGVVWYYTNKQRNLSFYSTSIYNGFSVSNILPANGFYLNSKSNASLLYKLHGGFTTTWSRNIDFSPNYLFQVQDENFQVNLGMYVGYSITHPRGSTKTGSTKILAGVWYRLRDAVIVSTGLSNAVWNVGFSYDSNIFSLSKTFGYGSSYEVSLAYKILNKNGFKRFSSPLI
jgi:type IX secretion system PorP/SprF family membrane protein